MQPLSTRTAHFTDSVIRRMTLISNQYGAVNLSQGFPDFDPPQAILNRLAEVAHEDFHQYSITWGAQNFREALAEKQSRLMGREIDPNGLQKAPQPKAPNTTVVTWCSMATRHISRIRDLNKAFKSLGEICTGSPRYGAAQVSTSTRNHCSLGNNCGTA